MPGAPPELRRGRRGGRGLSNRETGERGEALALRYLEKKGYEALERNYRTRYGEIDLVVRRGGTLVFVEVKSRRGTGYGEPLEAVTPRKQERVRLMAEQYLAEKGPDFAESFEEMRFDAVGVLVGRRGREVKHVEDAF